MDNKKWYQDALMVNRDNCWTNYIDVSNAKACKEHLEKNFSGYDGAVTDVCFCVFVQTAIAPNTRFQWMGDAYLRKKENGIDVDYTNSPAAKLYKCYAEFGVDPIQIFIDEVKKCGIRPWAAFRMNDCHGNEEKTYFLRSDFWYEEQAAGHLIGPEYGYFGKCIDFKYPRYREALLDHIEDVLTRYDFFGIELDFTRDIFCFDYKNEPECHKIMTEYIRQIKQRVTDVEKRKGHDIKISIRTCRSYAHALEFGFDIKTYVDEGLVDAVIAAPRWAPADSGIPIDEWRAYLGDNVGIIGGLESAGFNWEMNMAENSKGYAAAFYAGGADGIYFYNHDYTDFPRNHEAWKITRETCLEGHREFVVLEQDCAPDVNRRYKPLPLAVEGCAELPLAIGKVKSTDKVKVIIDFEGETVPTLSVGCKENVKAQATEPVHGIRTGTGADIVLTTHTPLVYDVSGISTDNSVTLSFAGNGTVYYVNIIVDAE